MHLCPEKTLSLLLDEGNIIFFLYLIIPLFDNFVKKINCNISQFRNLKRKGFKNQPKMVQF